MAKRQIDPEAVARARRSRPKAPNRRDRDRLEQDWWESQVGKELTLELTTGNTLAGGLKWVATFSILLDVDGEERLVLKHALASVQVKPKGRANLDDVFPESEPKPKPESNAREPVNLDHLF